ncbi:polysaccharide deacetylase family protein [Gillisia marina]|uniref:polysaccharide deacetylase family protein n=1 Tax=Gillisia marina TaxID=1167637 RepID=UPI00029A4130|nr:polysaccharide deacetylase family protein [Gillisia marina]
MLLIYTPKVTPRITYSFKHICTRVLGVDIKFTSKIEEFVAYEGMKFSYGKKRLGNELFFQNVELLLEQGFSDVEIKVLDWEETKCFFSVSENSDLPFDIFAASFYLLSRYEEYLPHVKDEFGRFPALESLAFKEAFLDSPVVDIWIQKFKKLLVSRFSEISFKKRKYKITSVISVSHVFNFKNKGFLRSVTGILLDLGKLKFSRVSDRLKVQLRLKKDPYNVFDDLILLVKKHKINLNFMFQLSNFNAYDRNINHNRLNYREIIKYVADYSKVGLRLGYFAISDIEVLKVEKKRFENIIHGPLQNVINPKYNLLLPEHYGFLNELEIPNDYSMGYPETVGFRAGTSIPFLFYDINLEITTPLKVHPYVFHSQATRIYDAKELQEVVLKIRKDLKSVKGNMLTIFKNRDFSEYANSHYHYSLLKQIHEI